MFYSDYEVLLFGNVAKCLLLKIKKTFSILKCILFLFNNVLCFLLTCLCRVLIFVHVLVTSFKDGAFKGLIEKRVYQQKSLGGADNPPSPVLESLL